MRLFSVISFAAIFALLLTACGSPPSEEIVARVNDSAITKTQWDAAVGELERSANTRLDEDGRRKVLESLVQSRLMATAAEKMLSETEAAELDARAALQRERLLVKEYLRRVADPAPVTDEAVRAWYAQHPEMFGGTETRHFELLTTERAPSSTQRKPVLDAMQTARAATDWNALPAVEGIAWVHRLANSENVLDERISSAAARLEKGAVSEVLFIGGKPYLIRVTHIQEGTAKPLAAVRGEIVRRLQLEQLQQAVEQAGKTLLDDAEVEYLMSNE
jgi:hypothetical protein